MPNKRHKISFIYAFEGLWYAITTQPNFIIHTILSLGVITLGLVRKIEGTSWAILFLTIGIGLAVELINTSIESLTDLATSEYHILAKRAKDTASAAMLVYAVFAVVVAAFIFL